LDFGGYLPRKLFPAIDLFLKQDYTPFGKHKSYFSNISGLVILRQFNAFNDSNVLFSVNSREIYKLDSKRRIVNEN